MDIVVSDSVFVMSSHCAREGRLSREEDKMTASVFRGENVDGWRVRACA